MVADQNEAEKNKTEAEKLSAELAVQDEQISKRRKVVEEDLARPSPRWSTKSVKGIKKSQLDEVARWHGRRRW